MRARLSCIWGLALALLTTSIYATEVDSFTGRDPNLSDSTAEINRMMNTYFRNALVEANKNHSCDQEVLNKALLNQFAGDLWSKIENDVLANVKIDKTHVLFEDSIYQDFSILDGFALYIADLGAILRFGEFYVGTDKLGHFLQCGYDMFDGLYLKGKTLQEVVNWSERSESTYYGRMTTGVYSYGDLASNYDGLYFWERATNTRLPPGVKPYFECVDKKWWLVSRFEISDYLNAAWDEGVNCNAYKRPEMEEMVKARISLLEEKRGQSLQCPIAPEQCATMIERYGNAASHLVTPKCFSKPSY